jgi:O-acetyl-ADP-ribose deacetylase (regulator of RNase III)
LKLLLFDFYCHFVRITQLHKIYVLSQAMEPEIVQGDLLDQDVDVIVNAWNRNIIPWWLLLPQGVSGAIKRRGGCQPFREVAKHGPIPLGEAVLTGAGKLSFKGIIHVAGINMLWRASERSIRGSVKNAMRIVNQEGYSSVAFPIIGAGSGAFDQQSAKKMMTDEFSKIESKARVLVVEFIKK